MFTGFPDQVFHRLVIGQGFPHEYMEGGTPGIFALQRILQLHGLIQVVSIAHGQVGGISVEGMGTFFTTSSWLATMMSG